MGAADLRPPRMGRPPLLKKGGRMTLGKNRTSLKEWKEGASSGAGGFASSGAYININS